MRSLLLTLFAGAMATSAPVFAQDAPASTTPDATASDTTMAAPASRSMSSDTAPASTFRGIRLEGNVGGDRFMSQGTHNDELGYGGTIGFDGTLGERFLIGPEGSIWRASDWNENCTAGTIGGGTLCNRSFQEYGVAVRAGVLVTPQFLVFGKGGYVNNEQRKRFTAPAGQTGYYDHFNTDGYQVGGGVEYGMGDRFSGPLGGLYVSGQYVYSKYNDHTSRQRVMLGVGVRFK